ncbi:MAG: hypothetical protein IKE70_00380 [Bacilli bacterium]|nr:hypothetical protein [Bacilli bacterium]
MKFNINKRKLLLGGIGFALLLTGCGKEKDISLPEEVIPILKLNQEEESLVGIVLDEELEEREKNLYEKYSPDTISYLYQESVAKLVYFYLHGIEDEKYLAMIQEYESVSLLHHQFFDTFSNQDKESIQKLFLEIREFLSEEHSFTEKSLATPIVYASESLYQDYPYSLMNEELAKIDDGEIFEQAKRKIKTLSNQR